MSPDLIFQSLIEKLESFREITPHLAKAIIARLSIRYCNRGEILLEAGYRSRHLWFLFKGYAREIGHDEDLERTSWFYFNSDFLYAYPSFFNHLPAMRDIQMLTEGILLEISYQDLISLRNDYSELNILIDRARDRCESERALHATRINSLTAQERYDIFYEKHKSIFNVARHKDIASFLKIKTDGLRRYNH